ncbi:MAG: hypothetical protein UZ21_OP11001001149 [Microgenomates bacterium OLB22]|nr:MAG: hypothetical protein UZ21_OP11001001149 [Microgenomates bacterium OLB22]
MAPKEQPKNSIVHDLQITSSLRALRQNGIYILCLSVFILIGIFGLPRAWGRYQEVRDKLTSERKTVQELESALAVQAQYEAYDPTRLLKAVDRMMPQKEDYFKLIQSMQQLAKANGVILVTHTSPFKSKTKDMTSVSVTMRGSRTEMERVLANFTFVSGRFITMESVTYKPRERLMTFDLQYHTAPRLGTGKTIGAPPVDLINELLSYESAGGDIDVEVDAPVSTSSDPFAGETYEVQEASGTAE